MFCIFQYDKFHKIIVLTSSLVRSPCMILRLAINSDSFLIPRFWFVVMRDLINYKLDNCKLGKNVRCRQNLKFSLDGFTVFTKLHVKK